VIGRKNGRSRFIGSSSEKRERRRDVGYPDKGRVWPFEERYANRAGRDGNGNNKKDGRRPSAGPQNGTELDLDEKPVCLKTDHETIEGVKIASENVDFDTTEVA
jgi:hypothetical protein